MITLPGLIMGNYLLFKIPRGTELVAGGGIIGVRLHGHTRLTTGQNTTLMTHDDILFIPFLMNMRSLLLCLLSIWQTLIPLLTPALRPKPTANLPIGCVDATLQLMEPTDYRTHTVPPARLPQLILEHEILRISISLGVVPSGTCISLVGALTISLS